MKLVENSPKNEIAEVRNIKKKQLDREFIGKIPKKKGQKLFGLCLATYQAYEVKKVVVESKVAKVDRYGKVTSKAKKEEYLFVKGDPVLFCMNMKNAVRKFQKMIDDWHPIAG